MSSPRSHYWLVTNTKCISFLLGLELFLLWLKHSAFQGRLHPCETQIGKNSGLRSQVVHLLLYRIKTFLLKNSQMSYPLNSTKVIFDVCFITVPKKFTFSVRVFELLKNGNPCYIYILHYLSLGEVTFLNFVFYFMSNLHFIIKCNKTNL